MSIRIPTRLAVVVYNRLRSEQGVDFRWPTRGLSGRERYEMGTENPWPVAPPEGSNWLRHAYATQDSEIYQRWLEGRPFPMYSRWGGMVAFDATPFTQQHQHLRFRNTLLAGWKGGDRSRSLGA